MLTKIKEDSMENDEDSESMSPIPNNVAQKLAEKVKMFNKTGKNIDISKIPHVDTQSNLDPESFITPRDRTGAKNHSKGSKKPFTFFRKNAVVHARKIPKNDFKRSKTDYMNDLRSSISNHNENINRDDKEITIKENNQN
jgi:hypothetical protein